MTQHSASTLGFLVRRSTWLALLCTAAASSPALLSRAHAADAAAPSQAQFGGQCTEALAEGRHVATNCTSTWTDKDGKTYCFSNDGAKKSFLENPAENLQRARSFMAASSVESTEKAMQDFTGSDAEALVKEVIAGKVKANNGIFPFDDPLNGEHLKLSYDDIDFTRTIDGYGFFPDVKFHDSQDAQRKYLVDFWVIPEDGKLQVQETRIYKEPLKVDGNWTTMARQPIPWWWIPASEHPGHLATKRGWEVMSAVEHHAVKQSLNNHGVFKRRRPLLRLHRLSGRRHQGPDLRRRFLGQRQGRHHDRRSNQGAQSARAQERPMDSGAALRVERPRQLPCRALNTGQMPCHECLGADAWPLMPGREYRTVNSEPLISRGGNLPPAASGHSHRPCPVRVAAPPRGPVSLRG